MQILNAEEMRRVITRLAMQAAEAEKGTDFVLIGIRTRGVILARRMQAELARLEGVNVPVGILDISLYRDDLLDGCDAVFKGSEVDFDIEGKNVVICGGGLSACDTAIEYGAKGRKISIVEMLPDVGNDVMVVNKISVDRLLKEYGVELLTSTRVVGITDEGVEVEHEGAKRVVPADVIVSAFGRSRNLELADAIQNAYPTKTTIIGDCMKPAKAGPAIREGFYAAMALK